MPLYTYQCPWCNHQMERTRPIEERHAFLLCDNPKHKKTRPMRLVIQPVAGIVRNPAAPRRR